MTSKWKRFDSLMMPIVFSDLNGRILYKNDLARTMRILRVGSSLVAKMDDQSRSAFASLSDKGTILTMHAVFEPYRCLAFPIRDSGSAYVAMLFHDVLVGTECRCDTEQALLQLVPSLRTLLTGEQVFSAALGKSIGRKSVSVRLVALMRKMLDLYLSEEKEEERDIPVGSGYFVSVLSYFFREVFLHQGVSIAIGETAVECGYSFYDHRKLTALLLSLIALIIDRTGSSRMCIDFYSEGAEAVFMLSAVLGDEWIMPDESLPDGHILFSLMRRNGIGFEYFNTVNDDTPHMVCRLFLPAHIAKPNLAVYSSTNEADCYQYVIDFLDYLVS